MKKHLVRMGMVSWRGRRGRNKERLGKKGQEMQRRGRESLLFEDELKHLFDIMHISKFTSVEIGNEVISDL